MDGTPLGNAVVLAFVALAFYATYGRTGGGSHVPRWLAFSATLTAIFLTWAGLAGYNVSRHNRFVTGTAWSDTVIWWEVGAGLMAATIAVLSWRAGLKAIRPTDKQQLTTSN